MRWDAGLLDSAEALDPDPVRRGRPHVGVGGDVSDDADRQSVHHWHPARGWLGMGDPSRPGQDAGQGRHKTDAGCPERLAPADAAREGVLARKTAAKRPDHPRPPMMDRRNLGSCWSEPPGASRRPNLFRSDFLVHLSGWFPLGLVAHWQSAPCLFVAQTETRPRCSRFLACAWARDTKPR